MLGDKKHGPGKLDYCDGNYYEGEWKNDEMDGYGKLVDYEGNIYEGLFKEG